MWDSFLNWLDAIKVIDQIKDVDAAGLFTNPWFLVPFILVIGYLIYKQAWRDIILIAILIGVWWVSGTTYMRTLVQGDQLSMEKILPVFFGGGITLGIVVYLLIRR